MKKGAQKRPQVAINGMIEPWHVLTPRLQLKARLIDGVTHHLMVGAQGALSFILW
jgi:hypothetical protein